MHATPGATKQAVGALGLLALALSGCANLVGNAPLPGLPQASRPAERLLAFSALAVGAADQAAARIQPKQRVALGAGAEWWAFEDEATAVAAEAALQGSVGLKAVEANRVRHLPKSVPTGEGAPSLGFKLQQADPRANEQWHWPRMKFPEAWGKARGQGVIAAVIDSGVDIGHPDLKANLLPLIDEVVAFGRRDELGGVNLDGRDGHGHGTHVCGLVGAIANNGIGVTGGAPEVKVLPVKVTTSAGEADDATIAKAITDAADQGAKVLNLSIGGPEPSLILLEALNYAFAKGASVVIAAGNDGLAVNYPAAYPGVISVGAITDTDSVASYSSRGPGLVIMAPGGGPPGQSQGRGILSCIPTYPCFLTEFQGKPKGYGELAGTSMASPQVTAAVAVLLSAEPGLSAPQVRTRLAAAAEDLGAPQWDKVFGFGVVDLAKSLRIGTADGVGQ